MAPEQAAGSPDIGPAADIYALGVIFYVLLTGRPPHRGKTPAQLLAQVRAGTFAPPSQVDRRVPRALDAICSRAMATRPKDRYGTAGELAEEVERWLADLPVRAWREPVRVRLARWGRRHRTLVTSAAAAVVVAVAGTFVGALFWIEARTRERLVVAESHVRDARIASQRGQWRAALDDLDRALGAGHPDGVAIELEKIKAWNALNEPGKAARAITALAERPDLGRHTGEVLLWRADVLLLYGKPGEAPALLRRAREAGLTAADDAYAQALLAEKTLPALTRLQRTLELDPFHAQAHSQLVTTLMLLGRSEEARQRAQAAALLCPDHPGFHLIQGFLAALDGDRAGAEGHLEGLRDQLDARQLARYRELFAGVPLLADMMNRWDETDPLLDAKLAVLGGRFVGLFQEAQAGGPAGNAGPRFELERGEYGPVLRLPPAVARAYQLVAQAMTEDLPRGDRDDVLKKLAQAAEIHPEGWLHFLRAQLLVDAGRWQEAEAAALQAAAMSSVVPGVRREAFYVAAMSGLGMYTSQGRKDEHLRRAIGHIRHRLALGPLRPVHADYFYRAARRANEFDLGRAVIADQLRQRPEDLAWLRSRAEIESLAGDHARAVAAAEEVLRRAPNDPAALDLRKKAVEALRKLTEKYKDGG
jgi:tetratricopeptide (TPR) repeat protein